MANASEEEIDSLASCSRKKLRSAIIKRIVESHLENLVK